MAFTERQSAPPPPPPNFSEAERATAAVTQTKASPSAPGDRGSPISGRQSGPPPSPPAPFDPGRIPMGMEKAQQQREQLDAEHARMRPNEAPTVMGNRSVQQVPPVVPHAFVPAGPKRGSVWPSYRYHRSKAPHGVIVKSEIDEQKLCQGEGWSTLPVANEVGLTVPDRLEMLDRIVMALGIVAEGDEDNPEDVLARVLGERDSFARQLAKKENRNGSTTK